MGLNMMSKAACHIELRKNLVREWVRDNTLKVRYVAGKLNLADIFTKEMRNGTHFQHLQDSFMSHLSDFVADTILTLYPCSCHPQGAPLLPRLRHHSLTHLVFWPHRCSCRLLLTPHFVECFSVMQHQALPP
jgi:hypothetical protein